jgi:ABC-type amino acid transport substrate-binding protein
MGRCCRWLFVAILSLFSAAGSAVELQHVRIAGESWPDHTAADGSGLAWDIFRLVFEPAGVRVQIESVPYMRSIGLVQRGEADAWVGSYLNEVDQHVFYPRWHYDADKIVALGLKGAPSPSVETLGQFRLAWVRGYEYQRYLPSVRHYREVMRRDGILRMLDLNHADFYLDAQGEVNDVLETSADRSRYRVTPLTTLPLYLGFADNARGRALAALFDQRMDEVVANGSLRPLFRHWQEPYPFD